MSNVVNPRPEPRRGFTERAGVLLRDLVLDATVELVHTRGWAQARMEEIARRAGVSKPTLYKHFGTKDQLAVHFVDREVERLLAVAREALARYPGDPVAALRSGTTTVLESFRESPLIGAILTDDESAASFLPVVLAHRERILDAGIAGFLELLTEPLADVDPAMREAMADTLVRVFISHAIAPSQSLDQSVDIIVRIAEPLLGQSPASQGPVEKERS